MQALDSAKAKAMFKRDEKIASKTAGWTLQDETGWLSDAVMVMVEAIKQTIASRIAAIASQGVFRSPGRQDCKGTEAINVLDEGMLLLLISSIKK